MIHRFGPFFAIGRKALEQWRKRCFPELGRAIGALAHESEAQRRFEILESQKYIRSIVRLN